MIKAAALLIPFLLLTACQPASDKAPAQPSLASGVELTGMDTSTPAQQDFFQYANGSWLANTQIPADKSTWGSFSLLREQAKEDIHAIVTSLPPAQTASDSEQTIAYFYQSFMDVERVEQLGMKPLKQKLDEINQLNSHQQLAAAFAQASIHGYSSPFDFWVGQDAKDPEAYTVYFTQSGLGLPDRDYYSDESERGQKIRESYLNYVEKLLNLADFDDPARAADEIVSLEMKLAAAQWNRVDNRDHDKTYNPVSLAQLEAIPSGIQWSDYLRLTGTHVIDDFIVRQPSYLSKLGTIVQQTEIETWRSYLQFHLLNRYASYLSESFYEAKFDFYGRTLSGIPQQEPRWQRAVGSMNSSMGELLGQLYVEQHFPPEAKQRMVVLVDKLKEAYRQSIIELDWMEQATRDKALEKLNQFNTKIGYPDHWRDFSGLSLGNDLVANIDALQAFNLQYEMAKLNQPVNRDEWFMPPQTVNAYYSPGMNEIVFPAAILQPPFFYMNADDAINYGAIGGVIGHEIGHGFDDQGSKYNGSGKLENWWQPHDREQFEKRTQQLVSQYNAYQPFPDTHINGQLTLGENIGDLGGLTIALKAYRLSLNGKPSPVIDGFTGDQRVFLGWAQAWRVKRREELARQILVTDPHSPAKYRVNGVLPNIPDFYQAFDVKEGDGMYLPPEQRVKIW